MMPFAFPKHIAEIKSPKFDHLLFDSATSKTGQPLSVNWLQFTYLMQMAGHEQVTKKLNAKMFTPWSPRDGATGRTSESVGQVPMLVFDLDKIDTCDIETVTEWCGGYAALIHTTFSHGVDGIGCFRVYIPLDAPVAASQYRAVHSAFLTTVPELAARVDQSCGDPGRCYFMPSCPPERHHLAAIRMSISGMEINAASLLTACITNPAAQNKTTPMQAPLMSGVPIHTTAILMPPPAKRGGRNEALTSAAGSAYAKGFTPEALKPAALDWGRLCIPPMDDAEVLATVESMWRTHTRNNPQATLRASVLNAPQTSRYLMTAEELMALPALAWRVRGVFPERGLGSIYGASGSGKTFLALDLACAIASRPNWFGHPVRNAPVVYVALEGEAGISQRMKAWEKYHSQTVSSQLKFVIRAVSLMESGECDALAAEIVATVGPGTVIFIDTLNRAAPTADENTSADMGRVIETAKRLADAVGGLVIAVHHSGKTEGKGLRGHSSLQAAMDAVVEVTRTKVGGRDWSISKSKDSGDGVKYGFALALVKLGLDGWGMEITSCAIEAAVPGHTSPSKPLRGKHQAVAFETLSKLLGGLNANPQGVDRVKAEAAVANSLDCLPKRKAELARDAIANLIRTGHLIESNGLITHT